MFYSFQERKAREITHYKQRVKELKSMEIDEIDLEYINLTSEYEYKKISMTIFIIFTAIVWLNVWKYFYLFMDKAIQYAVSSEGNGGKIAKVSFALSLSVILFMTLLIFEILINKINEMRKVHKNVMIVEGIRNNRNSTSH